MIFDLNCDLGEGCDNDAALLPLITSANIACGFHAGTSALALATMTLAARHQVGIGAHPSFPDREHFGRNELACDENNVFADCVYQVGALAGLARSAGLSLGHLKPHGALYNMACRDDAYARPIVAAAILFGLAVVGLPRSRLETQCSGRCRFVAEGFADRRYQPDGSLTPRSQPNAILTDVNEAAQQAEWLLRDCGVRTICVHGDNPHALAFVQALRTTLLENRHRLVRF